MRQTGSSSSCNSSSHSAPNASQLQPHMMGHTLPVAMVPPNPGLFSCTCKSEENPFMCNQVVGLNSNFHHGVPAFAQTFNPSQRNLQALYQAKNNHFAFGQHLAPTYSMCSGPCCKGVQATCLPPRLLETVATCKTTSPQTDDVMVSNSTCDKSGVTRTKPKKTLAQSEE